MRTENQNQGLVARLGEKLKILTGRKLSANDLGRIQESRETGKPVVVKSTNYCRIELSAEEDGTLIKEIVGYTWAVTDDFSHSEIKHRGWYPTSNDTRVYTHDGLLKERTIERNEPVGPLTCHKVIEYEPAGRWFGKRVRRNRK